MIDPTELIVKSLAAADAILLDLSDRRGIGDALSAIEAGDFDVWEEIRSTLAKIIREKMA